MKTIRRTEVIGNTDCHAQSAEESPKAGGAMDRPNRARARYVGLRNDWYPQLITSPSDWRI
jgi:hypothetical protein